MRCNLLNLYPWFLQLLYVHKNTHAFYLIFSIFLVDSLWSTCYFREFDWVHCATAFNNIRNKMFHSNCNFSFNLLLMKCYSVSVSIIDFYECIYTQRKKNLFFFFVASKSIIDRKPCVCLQLTKTVVFFFFCVIS